MYSYSYMYNNIYTLKLIMCVAADSPARQLQVACKIIIIVVLVTLRLLSCKLLRFSHQCRFDHRPIPASRTV